MKLHFIFLGLLSLTSYTHQKINVKELKCLVCQRLVEEMEKEVETVDPKKKIEVGHFRLDHKGDQPQKKVELRRSEVYLTELMEKICRKMDDYVRVRVKKTGKLLVIPLIMETGVMNPMIGEAEIIQDGDLNKSLKFYCENIVEENEEGFTHHFSQASDNLDIRLCSDVAKLCDQQFEDNYEFEQEEEEEEEEDEGEAEEEGEEVESVTKEHEAVDVKEEL